MREAWLKPLVAGSVNRLHLLPRRFQVTSFLDGCFLLHCRAVSILHSITNPAALAIWP
jgi:hypothetical protein